jgi:hypothetical protein
MMVASLPGSGEALRSAPLREWRVGENKGSRYPRLCGGVACNASTPRAGRRQRIETLAAEVSSRIHSEFVRRGGENAEAFAIEASPRISQGFAGRRGDGVEREAVGSTPTPHSPLPAFQTESPSGGEARKRKWGFVLAFPHSPLPVFGAK